MDFYFLDQNLYEILVNANNENFGVKTKTLD